MNKVLITTLIVHVMLCLLYFLLIMKRIAHLPASIIPVMVFVPVFGSLSVLLLEWMLIRKKDGICTTNIHKMNLGDSIYSKTMMGEKERPQDIVPLEEAILIDDVPTRRAIMMDILHRDSVQFLDLLMVARYNTDVEVTHYATTAIMEIQREFELAIQKMSVTIKENPENVQALDRYNDILGKYIDSGLLYGHLLYQQRVNYSVALAKSVELVPNRKNIYFKIIGNDIGMKDFYLAEETVKFMQGKWPSDENVWFAGLRVYVESGNSDGKKQLLKLMKQARIEWTVKGKEHMNFWYGIDCLTAEAEPLQRAKVMLGKSYE